MCLSSRIYRYSSTKYPYPGLALGPRHEFEWVPYNERLVSHRPLSFNFLGSITDRKPDRLAMQAAVKGHKWREGLAFEWQVFDQLVQESQNAAEYRTILLRSSFTLCPVGTGDDNFRFWEAIEAGSIPITVPRDPTPSNAAADHSFLGEKRDCPGAFEDVLVTNPPVVRLANWSDLPAFIEATTEREIRDLRRRLFFWNHDFWTNTTHALDEAIARGPPTTVLR